MVEHQEFHPTGHHVRHPQTRSSGRTPTGLTLDKRDPRRAVFGPTRLEASGEPDGAPPAGTPVNIGDEHVQASEAHRHTNRRGPESQ